MCPPLVEIGLTDLSKSGGARAPPASHLVACLLLYQNISKIKVCAWFFLESAENDSLFVLSNIFIVDSDSRLSISVIRSLILPGNPSVLSTHWVDIFLIGA